jgi:hypothetical protein
VVEVMFDTFVQSFIVGVEAQGKYVTRHGATMLEPGVGSWYLRPGAEITTFWDSALFKAQEALAQLRAAHHQRLVSPLVSEESAQRGLRLLNER